MGPEVLVGLVGVRGMKGECVEFVVSHDRQSSTRVNHGPDEFERFANMRAAVDEVTKKDGLTFRVPVDALVPGIAQLPEQPLEGVSVAVNVAD